MTPPPDFQPGDRIRPLVFDDPHNPATGHRETMTVLETRYHPSGNPFWLCKRDSGAEWYVWGMDDPRRAE